MKTQSKLSLFMAGATLALSGGAEAGNACGHYCKIKKPKPKVHQHKVKQHTCKLRTACHRGHQQHKPQHRARFHPVHNPAAPFHIRPCKPCSFKPLHLQHDPSHWYNKLADLT